MLHLLVLGVCVIVGFGLMGYWLLNAEPAKVRTALKWIVITIAVGAVIAVIARGNPSYLWTAGVFLLPVLMRWRGIARYFKNAAKTAAGPSPGQNSSVRTGFLEMTLDHDTGGMSGEVTAGQYAGRQLGEMSLEDLLDLLAECQEDPQSVQILESFIDRAHGDDWRFAEHQQNRNTGGSPPPGGAMSRTQALEILGVDEAASDQEIREAHKRLMMANHPDRGGSTYLAAQINQAKEVLLRTS
jgi:hypothetical protein